MNIITAEELFLHTPKTRFSRNIPSSATRQITTKFKRGYILDYGAGTGRNSRYLADHGFVVDAYDPFEVNRKFYSPIRKKINFKEKHYDIIIVSFVLNVLPIIFREKAIEQLHNISSDRLIIEVRSAKAIQKAKKITWKKFEDGYITSARTFQKGFTNAELFALNFGSASIWKKSSEAISVIFTRTNKQSRVKQSEINKILNISKEDLILCET